MPWVRRHYRLGLPVRAHYRRRARLRGFPLLGVIVVVVVILVLLALATG